MNKTRVFCECDSVKCLEIIELPVDTLREIRQNQHLVILDSCKGGPQASDTLVEKREGYSLYQEAKV